MVDILNDTANTILEKPVSFSIRLLTPRWWERVLIRLKLQKAAKSLEIRPTTLGNVIRISQLMLTVGEVDKQQSALSANYELFVKHGDLLAKVIATAIKNARKEPSNREIAYLRDNLTGSELLQLSMVVVNQLNVQNFLRTITLLRGVSLLKTEEKIASGEQSEDLLNTSD
jgi:hypothetical protein